MKHYDTKSGGHYGVSYSACPQLNGVLVQLGSSFDQTRIHVTPEEAQHLAYLLLAESYRQDCLAGKPLMTTGKRDSGGLARSTGVSCSVAGCVVDHTKQPPMVCKRCGSLFTARGGSWEHEHGGYCLYCEAESRSS